MISDVGSLFAEAIKFGFRGCLGWPASFILADPPHPPGGAVLFDSRGGPLDSTCFTPQCDWIEPIKGLI